MYEVEIANTQDAVEIREEFLRGVVEHALSEEQVREAEISVAIVDNGAIHELNREYLGHDYETDVLSFLLDEEPAVSESSGEAGSPRGRGKRIEGEIIVSAEMARQTAEHYSWSAEDELVLYLVHGLLHLCGYDDLTEDERPVMRARERAILQFWNLTPRFADPQDGSPLVGT